MGQADIYEFLMKHKGKSFSNKELAEHINQGINSVTNNTKRLRENHSVKFKYREDIGVKSKSCYVHWVK